jgi:hypothetical protein
VKPSTSPACCRNPARLGLLVALALVALSCSQTTGSPSQPTAESYRYTRTDGAFLMGADSPFEVLVPQAREAWIGPDGSGRIKTIYGDPIFFGDRDRESWGNHTTKRVEDTTSGPGELSYIDLSQVPTEGSALAQYIKGGLDPTDPGASSDAAEIFSAARALLWETVAPRDLGLAVIDLLRATDGVKSKADQDLSGRPATRFWVDYGKYRNTMWIDPATGALLGEQQDLLKSVAQIDATPPVTIKRATYVEARIEKTIPTP